MRNPASLVQRSSSIVVVAPRELAGERKLRAALRIFRLAAAGRVALDIGAAAGGFTRALLHTGVRRVYAVDAGHGQLLGSLRQNPRVVNLERTNLGALTRELIPEPVEVVTIDVSYLSLASAVPQLGALELSPDADLVALVKPQFELGLPAPPTDPPTLTAALEEAIAGIGVAGWDVLDSSRSPVRGHRGAVEFFVHARRCYDR